MSETSVCSGSRERLAQIDALRSELSETIKTLRSQGGADAAKAGSVVGQVNDLRQSAQALGLTKRVCGAGDNDQVGDTVRLFSEEHGGRAEFRGNQAVVLIEGKCFT